MKKIKAVISVICVAALIMSALSSFTAFADDGSGYYTYNFKVKVDNPVKSGDLKGNKIDTLFFEFTYVGKNGFGAEKTEKFDLKSGSNYEFLRDNFIRKNNDSYSTEFEKTLPGKLTKVHIKLNMDGGERLSFTINSITCNGERINTNTDYVSSAYYDSNANIGCSMAQSVIDTENSPYFESHDNLGLTQSELSEIVKDSESANQYKGQFRDQYNADIEPSVLDKAVGKSDSEINQFYSHSDETGMYKYTLWFTVENAININDADYDEVETFYIKMFYRDNNGYGSEKSYTLDMAYNDGLHRNLNPEFLSRFEKYSDDGYKTHFSVWVPGILTKIEMKLNMSGEKLCADLEKVTVGSIAVNTDRDYVSSVYFDSDASVPCSVPASRIVLSGDSLPGSYDSSLRDQYGAMVSEALYKKAVSDPDRYIYHQ